MFVKRVLALQKEWKRVGLCLEKKSAAAAASRGGREGSKMGDKTKR